MLPKRSPVPILTGDRRRSPSPVASPRTANRWSYDSDGVGLGIVAALDKPGHGHGHKPAVVSSPRPISASAARALPTADWADSESYTCVTCRSSPEQPPVTTVYYYEGAEVGVPGAAKQDEPRNRGAFAGFMASPPSSGGEKIGFLPSDFLSYCYLCHKKLHGKDIFMYRGEKAFCSEDCRYQQIVSDEYMETCSSEVTKASDVTVSAIAHDQFFLPGIAAA